MEAYLLHNTVPADTLTALACWDERSQDWQPLPAGPITAAETRVIVVHLWADYCRPCEEEFPFLQRMVAEFARTRGKAVQFLLISESPGLSSMRRFLAKNRVRMPRVPLYGDMNDRLAELLRAAMPGGDLVLPTTLLLDRRLQVRQAFLGSLVHRRGELASGIERLSRAAEPTPGDAR